MWPECFGYTGYERYSMFEEPDEFEAAKASILFNNGVLTPNECREYAKENKPKDISDYFYVSYESAPIGESGIRLQLISFDMEAYERDQKLKQIPTKQVSYYIEENRDYIDHPDTMKDYIIDRVTNIVETHYKGEIEKLKSYIEMNRISKPVATVSERKVIKGNVTNSDNIVCDVIEGNVVNCDNVKVREIRGNTVNCDIRKEGY